MTAHVTPSHDGLSSAPVQPLIFAGMLPRKRGTEGEQLGMATTQLCPARREGHAARRWARLDRETAGQREARLEVNATEWCKATGLGDGQAVAVQA